jgi:membrane protein implicated in regulation of membrane protease activity
MVMPLWMAWFVAAIFFFLLELAHLGFFFFWFAVGAIIAGFTSFFVPLYPQLVIFLIVASILALLARPIVHHALFRNFSGSSTNIKGMIGSIGLCTEKIDNLKYQGVVRVFGIEWAALSAHDDLTIEKGTKVKIIDARGVRLIVEPLHTYQNETK